MSLALLRRRGLAPVGDALLIRRDVCRWTAFPRPVRPMLAPAELQTTRREFRTSTKALASQPWSGGTSRTWKQRQQQEDSDQNVWWMAAGLMGIFGFVWALVPLYKMYCQSTGQGQAVLGHKDFEYSAPPEPGSAASKRLITIDFQGTVHDALPWDFVPQQRKVTVGLGETALAFYRAKNNTDRPIIGVSVYHMIPAESGLYFNKIQCFCFDEQLINPNEEVDLPIFFFVDPLMGQDSRFDHVDRITLSYLFFESDSDIPEEYEEFARGARSTQKPLSLDAPGPAPVTATAQLVVSPSAGGASAAPAHNASASGSSAPS